MPDNTRSKLITQGVQRAPNRAMLRAVGFGDADFDKPIVGIASAYSTITPCNAGLNVLAQRAEATLRASGAMPQLFGTITVSDGISMGTEGMKYSLVSREIIADSIETVCNAQAMDGVLAIGGCDKNMPGAMMAIARLNIPAIFVYGGTIKPGRYRGRDLTIVSAFEAVGEYSTGKIDAIELLEVERHACPGAGSCGGMYTANTMSSAIEALGLSLPSSSTMAAEDPEKAESAARSGEVLVRAIRRQLLPRQIMTRAAFENAIAVVMALGGSTNAVLHLLAIAHAAEVPLTIDDFETIRARVPVLCELKPSGRYVATDLHQAGGVSQVMKLLLVHGRLHGEALTITGQTIAEALADVPDEPPAGQDVIRSWSAPVYPHGHLAILELLRREGVAGATVFRDIAGYGSHRQVHTATLVELSSNLPLLAVIHLAQQVGFSMAEIQTLFHGFAADTPPAERWRPLAEHKLVEIDALIARAQQMKQILETLLQCGCLRLEECGMAEGVACAQNHEACDEQSRGV